MKSRLGLLVPDKTCRPHQHTAYQMASKSLQIWVRMLWYIENVDSCNGKYGETITSWHNLISLCWERTKYFHKCPHIEPQSPGRLLPSSVPPLCPLFPTLSLLSPFTLPSSFTLCFFPLSLVHLLCLKSKLPRQACLSPEAVIDRLTERNGEVREEEWARGCRVDASRACLNQRVYFCPSKCVIIGQKTPRTHRMTWRMISGGERNRNRKEDKV